MNNVLFMATVLFFCTILNLPVGAEEYSGSYYVNPVMLQDAQSVDRVGQMFNTMYGKNNQIGAVRNEMDNARINYEVNIARQAGMPYEEYLCNGDYVCMQRFRMHRQNIDAMNNYSNALQNQHMNVDANVYHYNRR